VFDGIVTLLFLFLYYHDDSKGFEAKLMTSAS